MSQIPIHVDPERLRSFANDLKKFVTDVAQQDEVLRDALRRLGETWQDQEYERFKRSFEGIRPALHRFGAEADWIVPHLIADADKIESFQRY